MRGVRLTVSSNTTDRQFRESRKESEKMQYGLDGVAQPVRKRGLRMHYGDGTLAMCRHITDPRYITSDRSLTTCGTCLTHLEDGVPLYRNK